MPSVVASFYASREGRGVNRSKRTFRHRLAIGSNPERNRAHNRRVVLEVIRLHEQLGRTEIARKAQLTPQAVTNIVEELLAENMLVERGRLRSGRGQPPIQFAINPDGPLAVGVEIAADRVSTVLLDLAGGVRGRSIVPLAQTGPDVVPGIVAAEIGKLCAALAGPPDLLGVGIVMPGPFNIDGMSSVGPATLAGWTGIDASALFAAATGQRVVIGNDAAAAAVGEGLYGAGRQMSSFCYLYFGVGIGLGVIQDGQPLRGAFGNAGEIGHVTLVPRHGCAVPGAAGALERHASVFALREHLSRAGIEAPTAEDIQRLHDAASAPLAEWIAMAADYLAPTVAMLENIFDPEAVIFGGSLPDSVLDAVVAALDPLPVSVATREQRNMPRVLRGQTGLMTAALGAAALPLLDTVSPHLSRAALAG